MYKIDKLLNSRILNDKNLRLMTSRHCGHLNCCRVGRIRKSSEKCKNISENHITLLSMNGIGMFFNLHK